MSAILNPLHPGMIFIANRKSNQTLITIQVILPPLSQFTVQFAPPDTFLWLVLIGSAGTPRDFATGNPVNTPLLSALCTHSQIRDMTNFALESFWHFAWAMNVEIKTNDPIVNTYTNGTLLTIAWDFTLAVMEIQERNWPEYARLWTGLYNLLYLLGGFEPKELDKIVEYIQNTYALKKGEG